MPEPEDKESKLKRVAKRPTVYVALAALAGAIVVFVASAQHDYGKDLPAYALELPLLLHLIHAGIAFAIIGFAGSWFVHHVQGAQLEEGSAGPFKWAFGKTTKALEGLRDAVEKIDTRQQQMDTRLLLVEQNQAGVKRSPPGGDGDPENGGAASGGPGDQPTAQE